MSYEEDYREPYRAECACGQGYLQFYKIHKSNDWGQTQEEETPVKLFCNQCKAKYHYEKFRGKKFLVPNGLSFPKQEPQLDYKYDYNELESLVQNYNKNDIKSMIADMTAPKHRFMGDLENNAAIQFANSWYFRYKKKSLKPMILYLQEILDKYDNLKLSCEQKKPYVDRYHKECQDFSNQLLQVEIQSIQLSFQYDRKQNELDHQKMEQYREEHRYDDFTAQVHYDSSYTKDFVNHYWDSYFIKKCIDPQHLSLNKPQYETPRIIIAKKYLCVCQICGAEAEILSSDMKISYDDRGYYLESCCGCHTISSFEAKTMDILNHLGITYIREKSFDGLVGDSGKPLRFDFALYKSCDQIGKPDIDLIIELQGPHHYKNGYYDEWGSYVTPPTTIATQYKLNDNFERQVKYDTRKKDYCSQHGIKLEYIKYTASNSYEQLETKIIKILKEHGYQYYKPIDSL